MTIFTYTEAKTLVKMELDSQRMLADEGSELSGLHVPMLLGVQGIGKSRIARDMSEEFKLPLGTINCGEMSDTTEMSGMLIPSAITHVGNVPVLAWGMNQLVARACYEPMLLCFDDLDKASTQIQGALLGVVGTRHFRTYALHPQTLLMAAGNRLEDDMYANDISESLRSRMTILEMHADLATWSAWGRESGTIHPAILGFLQWKPTLLHAKKTGVARFPTPRGWEEASFDLSRHNDPYANILGTKMPAWKVLIELRCGVETASDFWAWYEIVRNVDVPELLQTGKISGTTDKMAAYAACFALSAHLEMHGVKKSYFGLQTFVDNLSPDMRIAFVVQLTAKTRKALREAHPTVASVLMSDIVGAPVLQGTTP